MEALDPLTGVPSRWTGRRIEQASFDDFYVLLPAGVPVERWVTELRTAVREATGLRCSAGVARTKLLAMLATKRGKPDGMHCCFGRGPAAGTMSADERELLDQARVASIRGAGLNGLRPQVILVRHHLKTGVIHTRVHVLAVIVVARKGPEAHAREQSAPISARHVAAGQPRAHQARPQIFTWPMKAMMTSSFTQNTLAFWRHYSYCISLCVDLL